MLTAVDVAVAAAAGAGAFVFAVLAVRRQTRTALPGRRAAAVLWVTSALCAATAVLTVARPGWPYWVTSAPLWAGVVLAGLLALRLRVERRRLRAVADRLMAERQSRGAHGYY